MTDDSVLWKLEPDDINWTYKASTKEEEKVFEQSKALAHLLINDVVFINSRWYDTDIPELQRTLVSIHVNCSDIFAWGCADAEDLPLEEIKNLYNMWEKDPQYGPAVWCCQQRKELPQAPVYRSIMSKGIWNLDDMGLKPNGYDSYLKERKK